MCLDRDGGIYGTDKPVWLEGRAAWLFATLHERVEQRPEWLALARHGCDFLVRHCFERSHEAVGAGDPPIDLGKMYFLVARDGRPLRMRRYSYSEVFALMAFAAIYRVTREESWRQRAIALWRSLVDGEQSPAQATKVDPRTRPMKALSPLMCLLSVAEIMLTIDDSPEYERVIDSAVDEIMRDFVRDADACVLETVGPAGQKIDEPEGRVMNPGHAIETAWFIMEVARRRGARDLIQRAARVLDISFERGWDSEYGGLLHLIDVDGKPPTQLEHDMKLWWPHCETLYAALLSYHLLGDEKYARMYEQVHEYTFGHFPDPEHGEWFAYLRRDGSVLSPLKGGTWKGPFHVPRALLLCWKLLEEMIAEA
ncbi:MAG: AGE family epimerase/isomerase [Phycisphaerae bacterium]|nr:AGE family epimerase/isomerase [Phycisphaerae bacterium]